MLQQSRLYWLGLLGGIAFLAHAAIPNSHTFPLAWPLLAGAAGTLGQRRGIRAFGWAEAVKLGAQIGSWAAAIPLAFFLLSRASTIPLVARTVGRMGIATATAATPFLTVIIAMVLIVAAAITGAVSLSGALRRLPRQVDRR
jgi:hypothetical protein